jgi:uncharacterized membrane protein YgdD (TMEM256/DUF423 family)
MQRLSLGLDAFAGLMGASGVAAAAGAAHMAGGAHLSSVALVLLVHAAALLGLTARARDGGANARLWLAAAVILAAGTTLFSADVTLLTLWSARLFPFAAPTGGMAMILGWLVVFWAGLSDYLRRYR